MFWEDRRSICLLQFGFSHVRQSDQPKVSECFLSSEDGGEGSKLHAFHSALISAPSFAEETSQGRKGRTQIYSITLMEHLRNDNESCCAKKHDRFLFIGKAYSQSSRLPFGLVAALIGVCLSVRACSNVRKSHGRRKRGGRKARTLTRLLIGLFRHGRKGREEVPNFHGEPVPRLSLGVFVFQTIIQSRNVFVVSDPLLSLRRKESPHLHSLTSFFPSTSAKKRRCVPHVVSFRRRIPLHSSLTAPFVTTPK